MGYFFSYLLILLGATAITAGILRRFVYRGRLVFELDGARAALAFATGIILLVISMAVYVYAQPEIPGEGVRVLLRYL